MIENMSSKKAQPLSFSSIEGKQGINRMEIKAAIQSTLHWINESRVSLK